MPNHVHILMKLKEGYELIEIMRSIKSFTAKKINENENKTGPVWQSESYDRLIRDQKHFENVIRYIIANNKNLAWVVNDIVTDCVPQSEKWNSFCERESVFHLRDANVDNEPICEDADCDNVI